MSNTTVLIHNITLQGRGTWMGAPHRNSIIFTCPGCGKVHSASNQKYNEPELFTCACGFKGRLEKDQTG